MTLRARLGLRRLKSGCFISCLTAGRMSPPSIDSDIADVRNDSAGWAQGGSITAALFLQKFTNDVPWAHLDIAPTAWNNWEKGVRRINLDDAIRLCDDYGLSLDYIYKGRLDALPMALRDIL